MWLETSDERKWRTEEGARAARGEAGGHELGGACEK